MQNTFRYFNSSPELIRLTVMLCVCYPLSLRQIEYLLSEQGIDICHETVRFWWNRFGPMFAAKIRKRHNSPAATAPRRRNIRLLGKAMSLCHFGKIVPLSVTIY